MSPGNHRIIAPELLVLFGFLALGLALTFQLGPLAGWFVPGIVAVGCILLGKPRVLLFMYFAWICTAGFIQMAIPIGGLSYADELFNIAIATAWLGGVAIVKRPRRRDMLVFNRTVLFLLIFTMLSALLNRISLPALHFTSTYLGFIFVFYFALNHTQENDAKIVFVFSLVLLFIQLFLNAGWMFGFNPVYNFFAGSVDFAVGSLNGCNIVAYFCVFFITLVIGRWTERMNGWQSLLCIGSGVLALIQLYYTFTFHAYIFLVIAVVIQLGFRFFVGKIRLSTIFVVIVLSTVGISGFVLLSDEVRTELRQQFSIDSLKYRWMVMSQGPKGEVIRNVFVRSAEDIPYPILGAGPGNFASAIGIQYRSFLAEKYVNYFYLTYTGRLELQGGSITQHFGGGYVGIWSELGPFGFILFIGLNIGAFLRIARNYTHNYYTPGPQMALAEAYLASAVIMVFLNFITDMLSMDVVTCGMWFFAAILWNPNNYSGKALEDGSQKDIVPHKSMVRPN